MEADDAMSSTSWVDVDGQASQLDAASDAAADAEAEGIPLGRDYTLLPGRLDQNFEAFDTDGALRPTVVQAGPNWTKKVRLSLLSPPETMALDNDAQQREKTRAFDLLDALSLSGALTLEHTTLHVIVAATHCFGNSLMDTVVCEGINPIEKAERSSLIVASTIHERPPAEIVQPAKRARVEIYSPALFEEGQLAGQWSSKTIAEAEASSAPGEAA